MALQKQLLIRLYPNPATDYIFISGLPGGEKLKTELFDHIGQRMNIPVRDQGTDAMLNLSRMAPGIYYIRISQGNSKETRTIVKE
jgi:hypothetical protein